MIRETYRAESIALERVIAHFINKVPGQSLVNACRSAMCGAGAGVRIPPASMFYPGVANRSSALVIRLTTDEKLKDLDFVVPSR